MFNLIAALTFASAAATTQPPSAYEHLVCAPHLTWPCGQALHIVQCESTNNPRAYAAGNYGLFQVAGRVHGARVDWDLDALYDPETNIRVAHELYRASGWRPWVYCSRGF